MKWASALVLLWVGGCGFPHVDPDSPRLQATVVLREACDGFGGDAIIETVLIGYETDRLTGLAWTQARLELPFHCDGDELCIQCVSTIIDQIYGR